MKCLYFVSSEATGAELRGRFADGGMAIAATRIHASLNGAAVKQASLRGAGFNGIKHMRVIGEPMKGGE